MKKHNKKEQMRKRDYIILSCMFVAVADVLFFATLYKYVYAVTSAYNIKMLMGCLIIFTITGVLLTRSNDRYYINILINLILGTGTYTMLMFMYSRQFFVVGYGAFLLIILVTLIHSIAVAVVNRHRVSAGRIVKASMLGNRKLSAFILACLLLFSPIYVLSGCVSTDPETSGESAVSETQDLNRLAVAMNDATWNEKSMKERADAVQTLVCVICDELGVEDYPAVKIEKMNDYTYALYREARNEITVNTKLLNGKPEDIIETTAHETYHKYQNKIVAVYNGIDDEQKKLALFDKARKYYSELGNYVSGEKDFEKYKNQALESDAREFAKQEKEKLLNIIENSR